MDEIEFLFLSVEVNSTFVVGSMMLDKLRTNTTLQQMTYGITKLGTGSKESWESSEETKD